MWKIRVKIIHLWKKYSAAGGLTIEMVLIDSNVGILYSSFNYKDIRDGTLNTDYSVVRLCRWPKLKLY
ncbi:hypothetical protein HID58_052800 [Brassica napus]|uniref:DUF223 domain-containing protein n=1 Tax=Brassica napus TaxID=3708 RepID=A0ABQ8ACZ5_BRANA|nr:hypothetical protein HID58_052800 [Brassica napus]